MRTRTFLSLLIALFLAALTFALTQRGDVDSDELERIVSLLDVDPGEAVADVGAGDGQWSAALAETVGEAGLIYATEVDPDDLKKIRERMEREELGNVRVIEGSQDETGLPVACCDAVLLRRVYHHFQDPAAMQKSLRESLKRGGLLLVIDFGTKRNWSRPSGIPESRSGHGIDQDLVVSEMRLAGFDLVRELDWDGRDYALLFRVARVPD